METHEHIPSWGAPQYPHLSSFLGHPKPPESECYVFLVALTREMTILINQLPGNDKETQVHALEQREEELGRCQASPHSIPSSSSPCPRAQGGTGGVQLLRVHMGT